MGKRVTAYAFLLLVAIGTHLSVSFAQDSLRIDSLNHLLNTSKVDINKVDILVALAKEFEADKPQRVIEYMKQALPLADSLYYRNGLYQSHSLIGVAYSDLGKYDLALEYFAKGLALARELGDKEKISASFGYKGVAYLKQGDFKKGLDWFFKALKVNREINDTSRIATVLSNIGSCFQMHENYVQSLKYYQESLDIIEGLHYLNSEASNYLSMGAAYYNLGDYQKSLELYHKSVNLFEQLGDQKNLALCYENLGIIDFTDGDGTKALGYFLEALKINEESGDKFGMMYTYSNIGTLYSEWGNYSKAIESGEKSLILAREIDAKNGMKETYKALSKIYEKAGDLGKAYLNYKLYDNIKDSLLDETMRGQIAEMQLQYQIDQKEQQLKISNQERELLAKDNKIKEFRLYLLIAGIIGLMVIGGLLVGKLIASLKNTRTEMRKADEEIRFKSKELENFALRIVEKNEFLQRLTLTIAELQTKEEAVPEMRELSNTIKHNLYLDNDRRDLESRIDQINQAFLKKLAQVCPGLSKSEMRLCSLLMLDLSSKDMAAILNITPESVKVNRNRLRKKLSLQPHANIGSFLKEL